MGYHRATAATFIGGPRTGRTRREVWSAESADRVWGFTRSEDVGTPWYITHQPTRWTLVRPYRTLRDAQADAANGQAVEELRREADRELTFPETGIGLISNHDHSRAVLTWLAEHLPEQTGRT